MCHLETDILPGIFSKLNYLWLSYLYINASHKNAFEACALGLIVITVLVRINLVFSIILQQAGQAGLLNGGCGHCEPNVELSLVSIQGTWLCTAGST